MRISDWSSDVCSSDLEVARGRELTELVTDHLFGDRDRNELLSIVDVERQADELRQDGAAARPGLDRLAGTAVLSAFGLLEKAELDERAFPDGTSHFRLPLLLIGRASCRDSVCQFV